MPDLSKSKFTSLGSLIGTGTTTLYTVPNNHAAIVRHLSFSNNDTSNARTVTVQYANSNTSIVHTIVDGLDISASGYNNIVDGSFITLNGGDRILVSAEAAGSINAFVSVEEYFDPAR
tara:strand:+ start:772 stop:1125 length:354 start_codon:yes stop_codon:yes gene_type:complete